MNADARAQWEAFKATANKRVVYFEVYSEPDGFNRQRFAIMWWEPDFHSGPGWRAQHFNAQLGAYVSKYKRVEIIKRIER